MSLKYEHASEPIHSSCSYIENARYLKRTRDIGAAHGFFGLEALACLGIGQLALKSRNVPPRM